MPDITQGTDPTQGATTPASGGGAAGAQGGTGSDGWTMPAKFSGKSADDIARSYGELEKKLGGMPQLEEEVGKWRQYGQAWDPYLRQFGYQPENLARALEAKAAQAAQRGDQAGARQASQAAERAWQDQLTPQEQEQWIRSFVGGQSTSMQQSVGQALTQLRTEGQQYINNIADLMLRTMELKAKHPNLSAGELLKKAASLTTQSVDPLEWAAGQLTQPSESDLRARIEKEVREKIAAEQLNSQLTTAVGAGGSRGSSRAMRPVRSATAPAEARPTGRPTMDTARDHFTKQWSKIAEGIAE